MQLIIGNYNYSTWSMRPWLFVEHHGLPVEVIQMTLFSPPLREKLDKHFSNGKVPLLLDNDTEVWDSLAILEYLSEKFPQTCGWPSDPVARAVARSVSAEMHSSFTGLRSEAPMNCRKFFPGFELGEQGVKDLDRIQQIWRHCRSRFGQNGPWLFGDFSIADAMYAPVVMRLRSFSVSLDSIAQEYCDTMNQSTGVQQWLRNALVDPDSVAEDELDLAFELLDK